MWPRVSAKPAFAVFSVKTQTRLERAPAAEEALRRRRRTYFIDRLIAAFSMSSATAFGCET
jgi:hypothetical protein